jgi:hypothetical protein
VVVLLIPSSSVSKSEVPVDVSEEVPVEVSEVPVEVSEVLVEVN